MIYKWIEIALSVLLIPLGLLGCATQGAALTPVEREQIENVVKAYVVRDTNIPDYEVTIEQVAREWARVTIEPAGVEGGASTLYLQKQGEGVAAAPTASLTGLPGHEARTQTTSGWTIILGPQSEFAEVTLDELGVPLDVRPQEN